MNLELELDHEMFGILYIESLFCLWWEGTTKYNTFFLILWNMPVVVNINIQCQNIKQSFPSNIHHLKDFRLSIFWQQMIFCEDASQRMWSTVRSYHYLVHLLTSH